LFLGAGGRWFKSSRPEIKFWSGLTGDSVIHSLSENSSWCYEGALKNSLMDHFSFRVRQRHLSVVGICQTVRTPYKRWPSAPTEGIGDSTKARLRRDYADHETVGLVSE
jgi:hypothetical protein